MLESHKAVCCFRIFRSCRHLRGDGHVPTADITSKEQSKMGMRPTKKKPKSKRVACSQRYKIERKVREHHRRVRKEQRFDSVMVQPLTWEFRKLGNTGKRLKKDPGIPNLHPLKDELLRKAEEAKERERTEKERAQEARKLARQQKKAMSMERLQAEADARGQQYDALRDSVLSTAGDSAVTETSRRTYYKEFKKVIDAADVVLQVLDARDPIGCRCKHVEEAVIAGGHEKKLVLVLNKVDLVPREVVEAWLKYLRQEFPTVAFKASTQNQKSRLAHGADDALDGGGAECRGAGTLLKLLSNYCRNKNIKTTIRVGIVGYPNVGKSSLINSLKRSRACGVGATAGFTKTAQEVSLDKHIKLIDSPGIVMATGTSDEDLILRNCVKLEHISDPLVPAEAILRRCNHMQLMERYAVPKFKTALEFLQRLALRYKKLKRGGTPDVQASARMLLQDWNEGQISFYTMPPATRAAPSQASVLTEMSAAFDFESLLAGEEEDVLSSLKGEDAFQGVISVKAKDVQMEGDDYNPLMRDDIVVEEDEAPMDADAPTEYVTAVKTRTRSRRVAAAAAAASAAYEGEESNPQTNKKRKRAAKARKKALKKGHLDEEAEPYDFKEDFVAVREEELESDNDM